MVALQRVTATFGYLGAYKLPEVRGSATVSPLVSTMLADCLAYIRLFLNIT